MTSESTSALLSIRKFGLQHSRMPRGLGRTIRQNKMVVFCMWELRIPNYITQKTIYHQNQNPMSTDGVGFQFRHKASLIISSHLWSVFYPLLRVLSESKK